MKRNRGKAKNRDRRSLYESVDEASCGPNMAYQLGKAAPVVWRKRGLCGAIRSMARASWSRRTRPQTEERWLGIREANIQVQWNLVKAVNPLAALAWCVCQLVVLMCKGSRSGFPHLEWSLRFSVDSVGALEEASSLFGRADSRWESN